MLRSMNAEPLADDSTGPSEYSPARDAYAELQVTSNFTFLTGASHPNELVMQAATLGHRAMAITDVNTVAGIVRAHVAAKEAGIPLVVGTRLRLRLKHDSPAPTVDVLVYPTNAAAYGRMCRLLTIGKRRAPKGECHLSLHDLLDHHEGLLGVVVPPRVLDEVFLETVEGLRARFDDDRLSIAASCLYGEDDLARLQQLASLAEHTRIPLVATNDVHYHEPLRRPLQDVLTCIQHGCTIEQAGFRLHSNAERHLKPANEMARLFAGIPGAGAGAVERTMHIAHRAAGFSLDQLRYQYPDEVCPPGISPMQHLTNLAWAGSQHRYPQGLPSKVRGQIEHELRLIDELNYAPYFLTVHDLVVYARAQGILCQGRGAAANSTVCYCLGVTSVDPDKINLLFERFVSKERNEPPDIDIDFEHERREEVIQYLYRKYGRDRAALTAEVISYRGRSAVREVGKALGLSLDLVDRLAKNLDWWSDQPSRSERLRDEGLDPDDPTVRRLVALAGDIMGFPRHLSQHVGGFVITRGPLCEMVPVENAAMPDRTVIEWDKDDIDALGMLKVDCLGLGMLTCIGKAFRVLNARHEGTPSCLRYELHTIPPNDLAVYDMICKADTVGVFQIESRAQMQMLPRLRPRCFYDLVIEVAIVRPGPIQGDMVHPYLRRRNGEEPVEFPSPEVKHVLGKTLGVPLFQEQAMALAIVAAGFTPGEADQLRRAMAAWKRKGDKFHRFESKFVNGMLERGYQREFAERCFNQLRGFSEYGFPESHAASFAHLVYVSAWIKKHHPAVFAAALINSQPMGFYAPAQIVRDAQEHGVTVRPVDVLHSEWGCTLEKERDEETKRQKDEVIEEDVGFSTPSLRLSVSSSLSSPLLRLGLRLVKGLREEDARRLVAAVRAHGSFDSIESLRRAAHLSVRALRRLASADAFRSMGLDRQAALWHVRALGDDHLPMFDDVPPPPAAPEPALPAVPLPTQVMHDYASVSLSLKAHPVSFIRDLLDERGVTTARDLADERAWPHGRSIAVAGIALVRQRPATASGIVFITLEDDTGVTNLTVRPTVFQKYRRAARHGVMLLARGTVERAGQVIHIMTRSIESLDQHLSSLTRQSRDFH